MKLLKAVTQERIGTLAGIEVIVEHPMTEDSVSLHPIKSLPLDMARFKVVKGNHGSERGELLQKFLDRLNPPRVAGGFSKLTIGRLVKIFEAVPTEDLWPFYQECAKAQNFGSMFWFKVKGGKKGPAQ